MQCQTLVRPSFLFAQLILSFQSTPPARDLSYLSLLAENLELIERGELKRDYSGNGGASDEDDEEDFSELSRPLTPTQVASRGLSSSDTDALLSSTSSPVTMAQIRATLQQQHVVSPCPQLLPASAYS